MSQVSILNVPAYEDKAIYSAVCGHMEALDSSCAPESGMRVLIKPNLLSARRPELAVTTHYTVVLAVIRRLKELNVDNIVVADSPGGLYSREHFKGVCSAAGLRRPGIQEHLNDDFSFGSQQTRDGFSVKSFNLITPVLEADYIINLPKLKTHAMTLMSAGVKNLFGTIPGLQKPDMHCRFPNIDGFARMLCELAVTVSPQITILDAVDSMEGNGPGGGTVKHTGCTFASEDVFALDIAAAKFMGLDQEKVPHLVAASAMGLLPAQIELVGDDMPHIDPFILPDTVKSTSFLDNVPRPLRKLAGIFMDRLLRSYPQVDGSRCIGCGKCAESCPQHIITIQDRKASMPRSGCISCFCCQEMCPVHAISAKRGVRSL